MPELNIHGLAKHFGKKMAVDDVSFDVRASEVVGLLGPDGAGFVLKIIEQPSD